MKRAKAKRFTENHEPFKELVHFLKSRLTLLNEKYSSEVEECFMK